MYGRTKQYVKSGQCSPDIFIDKTPNDSELLYKLDKVVEYKEYIITKYEHRIDLIAKDIYGSSDYSWILLYINRMSLDDLVRGVIIKYISKPYLDNIINQI